MTSANKKIGYYNFRISYQYPMSNGTPMEITPNAETKGEKVGEKDLSKGERKIQDYSKDIRQPRVQKKALQQMEVETPRKVHKTFFPLEKGPTDPNSIKGHGV